MSVALSKCIFIVIFRLYNCAIHVVFRWCCVGSIISSVWVCHITGEATPVPLKKVVYPPFPHTGALLSFLITMEFVIAGVTSLTLNFQTTFLFHQWYFFCLCTDGLWLSYHISVKNWWFLFPSFLSPCSFDTINMQSDVYFILLILSCLQFIAEGNSLAIFLSLVWPHYFVCSSVIFVNQRSFRFNFCVCPQSVNLEVYKFSLKVVIFLYSKVLNSGYSDITWVTNFSCIIMWIMLRGNMCQTLVFWSHTTSSPLRILNDLTTSACMKVRGQLVKFCLLLLPWGFRKWNSGHQI